MRRARAIVLAAIGAAAGCYDFTPHPFASACDRGRCPDGYACDLARGSVCLPPDDTADAGADEDEDAGADEDAG